MLRKIDYVVIGILAFAVGFLLNTALFPAEGAEPQPVWTSVLCLEETDILELVMGPVQEFPDRLSVLVLRGRCVSLDDPVVIFPGEIVRVAAGGPDYEVFIARVYWPRLGKHFWSYRMAPVTDLPI